MVKKMLRPNRIKSLRAKMGWTMEQLGDKIGATKATIYKIETARQSITEGHALGLARAFGVTIDDLYESESRPVPAFAEEAAPFTPATATFESHIPLEAHQSWYKIHKSHLDQLGYVDGMLVIIDISREAVRDLHIGDVVIANAYRPDRTAETIVRQFIPPALLVTNSLKNNLQSLNLNTDDVAILGMIVYPRLRG